MIYHVQICETLISSSCYVNFGKELTCQVMTWDGQGWTIPNHSKYFKQPGKQVPVPFTKVLKDIQYTYAKQHILHRQYHIWATAQFLPISQVVGHPHIWYPHISVSITLQVISSISRKQHQKPAISTPCSLSTATASPLPWDLALLGMPHEWLGFKIPTIFDNFEVNQQDTHGDIVGISYSILWQNMADIIGYSWVWINYFDQITLLRVIPTVTK